jgi:predicted RNA-binding Zn-ribbon protein involved in translation (DUF1610 family)
MATDRQRYMRAWAQMTRLGAAYFGLLVMAFVLFLMLGRLRLSEGWVVGLPVGVAVLAIFAFGRRWLNYPCPRCGNPFRKNRQTGRAASPFQSACANCGLVGGSLPTEGEA